jgi:hypothetical protein
VFGKGCINKGCIDYETSKEGAEHEGSNAVHDETPLSLTFWLNVWSSAWFMDIGVIAAEQIAHTAGGYGVIEALSCR